MRRLGFVRGVFAACALFVVCTVLVPAASANTGWVKGEIRLNLRAGAGTQFKILGGVKTGDEVVVLATRESWTRVQTGDGKIGWIPAGYLETEPPPVLRLQQLEGETATLRSQLEELRAETADLRETNATLTSNDSGQREEIEALKIENFELRAGAPVIHSW